MINEKELKDILILKIGIQALISELQSRKGCQDIIIYLQDLLDSIKEPKVLVKEK